MERGILASLDPRVAADAGVRGALQVAAGSAQALDHGLGRARRRDLVVLSVPGEGTRTIMRATAAAHRRMIRPVQRS